MFWAISPPRCVSGVNLTVGMFACVCMREFIPECAAACVAVCEVKDARSFSTVTHLMFPSHASNVALPKFGFFFFLSNLGRDHQLPSASLVQPFWGQKAAVQEPDAMVPFQTI